MITILRNSDGSSLTPDACLVENWAPTATLTRRPIEDGSVVSDNLVANPWQYTASIVVSETPLQSAGLADGPSGVERVQSARKFLTALLGLAAPGRRGPRSDLRCLIGTLKYGALDNMVLLSFLHRVDGEASLTTDLVFEQVKIARGVSVTIPVSMPRVSKQAKFASAQKTGAQGTGNADPATDAAARGDCSTAFGLLTDLGVL